MNFKRFSPAITLFLVLTAFSLFGSSQVQAGASNKSGNPYGNGTFFSDQGTFSAILRSSNAFLGVVQFSTTFTNTSTNATTNSGFASIYSNDQQFQGTAQGTLDPGSSTIAVTYVGTANGVSYITQNQVTTQTVVETNGFFFYAPVTSNAFSTNTLSNYLNGSFSAKTQNDYPIQTFSGSGQAAVTVTTSSLVTNTSGSGSNQTTSITTQLSSDTIPYNTAVQGSRLTQ